jgi:predicted porin
LVTFRKPAKILLASRVRKSAAELPASGFAAKLKLNFSFGEQSMKKSLLAVAVVGALASAGAQAQTSVTMYGVADAFVENIQAGTNKFGARVGSGGLNGSRWGVRGSEDLGGGLKGVFTLEAGYNIDTGTRSQGGTQLQAPSTATPPVPAPAVDRLFGRQAFVGLTGGFGALRIGRQYTPIGNIADLAGTGSYDVLGNASLAGGAAYRTDNAITYMTPSLGGFSAELQWSPQLSGAEQADASGNKKLGAHAGAGLKFATGPVSIGLGYLAVQDINTAANTDTKVNAFNVFGSYDIGFMKIGAFYNNDKVKGTGTTAANIAGLNLNFPIGSADLGFTYAQLKDMSGLEATNEDDADYFKLQGVYNVSKRTAAYVQYATFRNKVGLAQGLNSVAGVLGEDPKGLRIGVRHFF